MKCGNEIRGVCVVIRWVNIWGDTGTRDAQENVRSNETMIMSENKTGIYEGGVSYAELVLIDGVNPKYMHGGKLVNIEGYAIGLL